MSDHPNSPYGIAGRSAAEAVLEYGHDGSRLRTANDAFLLSRIARAVVNALNTEYVLRPRGEVSDWRWEDSQRLRLSQALRLIRDTSPGYASNVARRALIEAGIEDPPEDGF